MSDSLVPILGSLFAAFFGAASAHLLAATRDKRQRIEKLLLDIAKAVCEHGRLSMLMGHAGNNTKRVAKAIERRFEIGSELIYLNECVKSILKSEGEELSKLIGQLISLDQDALNEELKKEEIDPTLYNQFALLHVLISLTTAVDRTSIHGRILTQVRKILESHEATLIDEIN